ncbi:hypothetical protein ABZ069_37030 [Streptomyces microflavus]|uniref:hypothetical protein n=1 Tax=Streptomyces microflavus TaxID=1919 RepID=UPI0033A771FB
MRWSWKAVRTWLTKLTAETTPPAPALSRGEPAAWRRLPVLRATVRISPWTVVATARTATARAGTRSLVHRMPAPTGPGTAPRGRADSLVGALAVTPGAPPAHLVPRHPRTPGHAAETAADGAVPESAAEETRPPIAEPLRRVPAVARPTASSSPSAGSGRDTAAAPPVLTRATDAYVGEPRPVTPPPTRSEFDLQLDAYRPAWMVAQLQNGGDLPHYVLARRENGPKPPGAPTPPDRQPALPPTVPAALPTAAADAPRASLAESRRRDLAHRSRRHPAAYQRHSTAGTTPEGADALRTPTADEPPGTPLDAAVAVAVAPGESGSTAGSTVAAYVPAEEPDGGPGALPDTTPVREGASTTVVDEVPAEPVADSTTDTQATVSPGWEAEWSRKQAARHRTREPLRSAPPRASEHMAADTRAPGHTGSDTSSGPAPSVAPESDAPTEDDTAGAPASAVVPVVPALLAGAPGPQGTRDPFRPSAATDTARPTGGPSAPGPPELIYRTAKPRPSADPERPRAATAPLDGTRAASVPLAETEGSVTRAAGAGPAAAAETLSDPVPTLVAGGPDPADTVPSPGAEPVGTGTTTAPTPAPGGTPGRPLRSAPASAGPTGPPTSTPPTTSVAFDASVAADHAGAAVGSPNPDGPAREPEGARPPATEPAPAPTPALFPGPTPTPAPLPGPVPVPTPTPARSVVPRVLPSSAAPDAADTVAAYRTPRVRPLLTTDPIWPSGEGVPILVHRPRGYAGSVLIQKPAPAVPAVPGAPATGTARPFAVTPVNAPGPAAFAAGPPVGTGGSGPSTDATAARPGTAPYPDASGAPLLRLVHSVTSPAEAAVADASPTAAGGSRTHRVLYSVPQYVASLFAAAPPAGGPDLWAPDEPEAVSAEAMALAVQRAAVGSDLMPVPPAPSWTGPGPQARAGTRWFGDMAPLHHVRVRAPQDTVTDRAGAEAARGPEPSASAAPPEASAVPPYEEADGGAPADRPPVTFSAGAGHPVPPSGGGPSSGGPPPGLTAGSPGVPLEQTPEWAALLGMLADRDRIYARFDDPAVLDALAARLYDRILAHVRQELVVERERHGLLAPRP